MAPRPTPEPEQTSWKVLAFSGVASLLLVVGSLLLFSLSADSNNSVEIVSPPVDDSSPDPTVEPARDETTANAPSEDEGAFGPSGSDDGSAAAPTATAEPEPTESPSPEPSPTARPTATPQPTPTPDTGAETLAELAASLLGGQEPTAEPKPTARPTQIPALPRVIPQGQDETPLATPIPRRPTAVPTAVTRTSTQQQATQQQATAQQVPQQPAAQPAAQQPAQQPAAAPAQHEFEYVYTNKSNGRGGRQVIACNVGAVYVDLNADGRADGYLNSPCDPCPSGSLPTDWSGDGMLDC